jgi:SAM-dependent methyltransferase
MISQIKGFLKNKVRSFLGINDLMEMLNGLYLSKEGNQKLNPAVKKYENLFHIIQNDCQILRQDTSALASPDITLMNADNNELSNNQYFSVHKKRLIYTSGILRNLKIPEQGKYIVDMGAWIAYIPVLQNIFHNFNFLLLVSDDLNSDLEKAKYENIEFKSIDFEFEKIPLPDKSASLILLLEVIEHFSQDPMFVMSEVNRVLVDGGKVVISTPNLASWRSLVAMLTHYSPYIYGKYLPGVPHGRHIHEYVPRDVNILLQSAGFEPLVWTENVYHTTSSPQLMNLLKDLDLPTEDRGDTIFVIGTKVTGIQERYPIDLYDI